MIIRISQFKIKVNQKRSIYVSMILVFALFSFYLFSLGGAVANAAKMTKLEREIGVLSQKVGEVESQLIVSRNHINLGLASALGFKEIQKIKFIPRKSVAATVALNQNIQ